jgi:hypothetical protein
METDSSGMEAKTEEEAVPEKTCRPPPIILTSIVTLIQLPEQLKSVVKGEFEFRSTRNGTRVIAKGMADFERVKSHFTNNNLSYYSFYPKSQKPIKAVISHLPPNTPAEDISDRLVNRGFDVISVMQLTTRRSSTEGAGTRNHPLFLITLPKTAKSQEFSNYQAFVTSQSVWRHIDLRLAFRSVITANNLGMSGQTVGNNLVVCGAGTATCTKSVLRKETLLPHKGAVTASWRRERKHTP